MDCGVNKLIFGITGTEEPLLVASANQIIGLATIIFILSLWLNDFDNRLLSVVRKILAF